MGIPHPLLASFPGLPLPLSPSTMWKGQLQGEGERKAWGRGYTPFTSPYIGHCYKCLPDQLELTLPCHFCCVSRTVRVVLKVDKVTMKREEVCGGDLTFPIQRDKLFTVLKQQVREVNCSASLGKESIFS